MRVFLVSAYSGEIHAEIETYNRRTHMAHFRHANGVEYNRIFLPDMKYNKQDYRVVPERELNDAQLAQLRAGYPAREADGEAPG